MTKVDARRGEPCPRARCPRAKCPRAKCPRAKSWARRWTSRAGTALLLGQTILAANPVWSRTATIVKVTSGDHPGFGRLVLDAPGLTHALQREGNVLRIVFGDEPSLGPIPAIPRNILAIRPIQGGIEMTVTPGASVRDWETGNKLVLDVDDTRPARPRPARAAPDPAAEARPEQKPDPPSAPRATDARAEPAAASASPPAPALARQDSTGPEQDSPRDRHGLPPTRSGDRPSHPPQTRSLPGGPVEPGHDEKAAPGHDDKVATGHDGKAATGHDDKAAPGLDGKLATSHDDKAAPGQDGKLATSHDDKAAPGQDGKAEPGHDDKGEAVAPRPAPPPPAPVTESGEPEKPATTAERGPEPAAGPDPSAVTGPEQIQVWPVTGDAPPVGPVALVATRSRPPPGLTGTALQIPFADPIGAALFSRGAETYAVFDERRPIDLAGVRDDPVFGSAIVTIFPAATVIRLMPPKGSAAVLSKAAAGWRISIVPATPRPAPMTAVADKGVMTFAAEAPGQVVAIADPASGATLLVGTQRKPGQAVLTERHAPEFLLPAVAQGIVVEPLSDAIGLRVVKTGFVLSGKPAGLALSATPPMAEALMDAARLTRRFEFPGQSTDALTARARRLAASAAVAPPLARGPKRRALAECLIGLGMGAEAQTWLRLAMKDDPAEAASPVTAGLAAIAALIANRPADASGLSDPGLTGTDEVALWRAIQAAMTDEGSPAAAAVFAATAPLLFTYPDQLRRRVMPLAMETMILGGEAAAAAKLLKQREDDPTLAYARALLKQALGDNDAALTAFDTLAKTRSSYDHARASVRAVELRLAMGQLDSKAAADALQTGLYAWRGDARDLALRRRIAALRQKEGAWRTAFSLLRGVKADFPNQAAEIDRQMKEAFAALPHDPSVESMPPADLIGLLEENADLMADGPDGEPMRMRLAEKLMALDLPKRADPLLTRLMGAAPPGPSRAGLGATLAALRLREDDADGALQALRDSKSGDLPAALMEKRALLTARVQAKRGDRQAAIEALAGLETEETADARASILEGAQDWEGAKDALTGLAAKAVPTEGPLDDKPMRILLRLATAAARAGDDTTLASLREQTRSRLGTGPMVDMFRLLTAEPVLGIGDLGRARAEIGLVRALSATAAGPKPATKAP